MKRELRNIAIGILVCLAVATAWSQPSTVTVTSTAPIGCGAFFSSTKCDTTVGSIPAHSSTNLTVNVSYDPLYLGQLNHPNVLEFYGLYDTYAIAHVNTFVMVDTGTKDAKGLELWTEAGTFTSSYLASPYGSSYAGLFTGSWTATISVGPTVKPTGCGRGCGASRTPWIMDNLVVTINNQ